MINNFFYYFESAIDIETCNKIISLGKKNLSPGVTGDSKEKQQNLNLIPQYDLTASDLKKNDLNVNDVYVRDSLVSFLDEKWIYDLLQPYIIKANFEAGWNFELDYNEVPQFTMYEKQGFYSWHQDGLGDTTATYKLFNYGITDEIIPKGKQIPQNYTFNTKTVGKVRKLSLTLNLTNPSDYEGGDLLFDVGNHNDKNIIKCDIARKQGSIIVFPSFLYHCVSPITKGTRYSLVNWILGRPFK
jgi:PKHD-type hydroxylase